MTDPVMTPRELVIFLLAQAKDISPHMSGPFQYSRRWAERTITDLWPLIVNAVDAEKEKA